MGLAGGDIRPPTFAVLQAFKTLDKNFGQPDAGRPPRCRITAQHRAKGK